MQKQFSERIAKVQSLKYRIGVTEVVAIMSASEGAAAGAEENRPAHHVFPNLRSDRGLVTDSASRLRMIIDVRSLDRIPS